MQLRTCAAAAKSRALWEAHNIIMSHFARTLMRDACHLYVIKYGHIELRASQVWTRKQIHRSVRAERSAGGWKSRQGTPVSCEMLSVLRFRFSVVAAANPGTPVVFRRTLMRLHLLRFSQISKHAHDISFSEYINIVYIIIALLLYYRLLKFSLIHHLFRITIYCIFHNLNKYYKIYENRDKD